MAADLRPEVRAANNAQMKAADPRGSRLASANAGSGKTKVLVDRVSRLLLRGTEPDKILCLTYTKAAANEMQNRLFRTLGEWSVMSEDELNKALNELLGGNKQRDREGLANARRLFAKALETPEGLKVQTIHAFCERILGRFPIEAGIQPGFDPIDDADMRDIRKTVEMEIYQKAYAYPDSELARAVRVLASQRADQAVESLMNWAAGHVDDIKDWQERGLSELQSHLQLGNEVSIESVKAMAWQGGPTEDIRMAAQGFLQSTNANDQIKGQAIIDILEMDEPVAAFDAYFDLLTTTTGAVRKSYATKSAAEFTQEFYGVAKGEAGTEIARLSEVREKLTATKTMILTRAIFDMSGAFVKGYEREKMRLRGLDFNDQISLVKNLLSNSEYAAWVLYKLDHGVQHILVDEAQDTAPSQWSIIDAVKAGFDVKDPGDIAQEVKTFFAVGDEKQSIYSFQGARPEQFMARIRDAEIMDASSVRMEMSFRSAPEILRVVDAVFDDCDGMDRMFDPKMLSTINDRVSHNAFREDRGMVELWPLSPAPEAEDDRPAWDTRPVDSADESSAREQLAQEIANRVKTWLDEGEPIYDRENKVTRPMRADDILILVRSRNDFFDGIIRNLKANDIAVAGADRLVVSEALVVQDMLALTRFVLLPSDDLSLAEVLKGPFFGFDDEALFELCYAREDRSLWQRLCESDDAAAQDASEQLKKIISYSRRFAPFEFYRRVLDMIDVSGQSYLKAIYARLSLEAQDALEAFLNKALAHQRQSAPSLQNFLQFMQSDKQDIKREMDNAQGEVRVMTVHGAKGLEAPVVILPQTTQTPTSRNSEQLLETEYGLAYLPSENTAPESLKSAIAAEKQRQMQEYMRLLYVAMTRAESRLVICGYALKNRTAGMEKACWYEEVSSAMERLNYSVEDHPWGEVKFFGGVPEGYDADVLKMDDENVVLPDWAYQQAKPEKTTTRRVTPSNLLVTGKYADVPVRSPLSQSVDRFRRGNLTHKLLEILPELDLPKRRSAAQAFLAQQTGISDAMRQSIEDEVMTVIEHPDYAPFFGEGSQAEVNLAGQGEKLPQDMRLNAQIDRLAVTEDSVYIIDYKSNRPPPTHVDDVPEIYWGQMAAYREMIRLIYPDKQIVCGLLWTDGPDLMILSDEGLDSALTRIQALPT